MLCCFLQGFCLQVDKKCMFVEFICLFLTVTGERSLWSTVQAHAFHFLKEKLQYYGYHTIMELKIQLDSVITTSFHVTPQLWHYTFSGTN